MRFQSALLALPFLFSTLTAAQHNLHARRSDAAIRARHAAAEVDFYNKLIAREAEAEADAEADPVFDYYDELVARNADAEADPVFNYFDELVARGADADPDFDELIARDAELEHDHGLFARQPGNLLSTGRKGGASDGGEKVSPNPPQHPKLKKCALCGTMCPSGETWCRSKVHHKGTNGWCVDVPGQKTKRGEMWEEEKLLGGF